MRGIDRELGVKSNTVRLELNNVAWYAFSC